MANGRESPIKQNRAQILKIVIVILRITSLMMNDEAICFIIIQYRSRSLTCICLMSFFLPASSITDVSHERGNINVYVHLSYTLYIYIIRKMQKKDTLNVIIIFKRNIFACHCFLGARENYDACYYKFSSKILMMCYVPS